VSTIIVGGNGYIGSRIRQDISADVIDIGWYDSKRWMGFDIKNYDNIILLAGHSSMWMCENDPRFSWENNVNLFHRITSSLRQDQTLIYASSASVYGSIIDAKEDMPLATPVCHYDMQKQTLDIITSQAIANGKNIVGLRFGTVNGISPHTRTDLMINSMVYDALTKSVINVSNPNKHRALLFIDDLSNAMQMILNNPVAGIYNLSSINTTVREIAASVAFSMSTPVKTNDQSDNPYSFTMDCSKFIETYGHYRKTKLTDVINGLRNNILKVRTTRRDYISKP